MNKKSIIIMIIAGVVLITSIVLLFVLKPSVGKGEANLKIDCDGKNLSKVYKAGDSFECSLAGDKFTITIKDVSDNKINLEADKYGLYPRREDGTISLVDKVKEFTLEKGDELNLELQATDSLGSLKINW